MILTSPAFDMFQDIPDLYACGNHSPPFSWTKIADAKSYALLMIDLDASNFVHFLVPIIIGNKIPENYHGPAGLNSAGRYTYFGPCPPPGSGPHRYKVIVYALDISLTPYLDDLDKFFRLIDGHVLDSAQLIGMYSRSE